MLKSEIPNRLGGPELGLDHGFASQLRHRKSTNSAGPFSRFPDQCKTANRNEAVIRIYSKKKSRIIRRSTKIFTESE